MDLAPAGQILTELYTGNFHCKSVQQRHLWLNSNKNMKRPTYIYVVGLCNSNTLYCLRGTRWGQQYRWHLNIMQACLTMNMKRWALWMWHCAAGRIVQTSQSIAVPSVSGSWAYSFLITFIITTSHSQLKQHMIRNTLHSPVGYQTIISSFIKHDLTKVYAKRPSYYLLLQACHPPLYPQNTHAAQYDPDHKGTAIPPRHKPLAQHLQQHHCQQCEALRSHNSQLEQTVSKTQI